MTAFARANLYLPKSIYVDMEGNSFEVVMIRKVPYLTAGLFHLLTVFTVGLFIVNIFFLPTAHASDEMKFAYFILVTPKLLQDALYVSLVGFLIILPIYLKVRLRKPALLTFAADSLALSGKGINETIPISDISEVYCIIFGCHFSPASADFLQKE